MAITLDRLDPADASAIRGTALYAMEQVEDIVSVGRLDAASVLIEALVEQLEALGASYQEIVGLIASIAEKLNERAKALARSILAASHARTREEDEPPEAVGAAGKAAHIRLVVDADEDGEPPPLRPIDSDEADWTELGLEEESDVAWARRAAEADLDAMPLSELDDNMDGREVPRLVPNRRPGREPSAREIEMTRKRFEPAIPWVLSSQNFRSRVDDSQCRELLTYWDSLCEGRRMPSRKQLDPNAIGSLLRGVGLIDVVEDGDRFRYRLVGRSITEFFGARASGLYHDRVPLGAFGNYLAHLYRSTAATRRPLYLTGGCIYQDGTKAPMKLLVLPLAPDGRTVDMLMMSMHVFPPLDDDDQALSPLDIVDKEFSSYTYE